MSERAAIDEAARRLMRIVGMEGSDGLLLLVIREDLIRVVEEYQALRQRVPTLCDCKSEEGTGNSMQSVE